MGLERFKLDHSGMRGLLRSTGVRADLHARALRVKAVADAELLRLDAPYPSTVADSSVGANRASATVLGVPLPLERSRRILGGAIDAAG
jgi:hypothetical protein